MCYGCCYEPVAQCCSVDIKNALKIIKKIVKKFVKMKIIYNFAFERM